MHHACTSTGYVSMIYILHPNNNNGGLSFHILATCNLQPFYVVHVNRGGYFARFGNIGVKCYRASYSLTHLTTNNIYILSLTELSRKETKKFLGKRLI
jgi:hypothetical protein